MSNNENLSVVPTVGGAMVQVTADPAALAAAAAVEAEIKSAYWVAINNPRSEANALVKIKAACRRPVFAEKAEYAKPVAGKIIVGASVRFAELAMREWGNIRVSVQTVYEDNDLRRTKVSVGDMETNSFFSEEITVKKTVERKVPKDREIISQRKNTYDETVYLVVATDDEMHNKEASMVSKVMRNLILRLIPADIIEDAIQAARETNKLKDKADPKSQLNKLMESFFGLGILPADVEKYLGHALDGVTPDELATLRAIYTAIATNEAKWKELTEIDSSASSDQNETAGTVAKKKLENLKEKMLKKGQQEKPPHDPLTGEVIENKKPETKEEPKEEKKETRGRKKAEEKPAPAAEAQEEPKKAETKQDDFLSGEVSGSIDDFEDVSIEGF